MTFSIHQFFLLFLHGYIVHSQDFTPDQINAAVAGAQRDVQQRQSAAALQRQGAPAGAAAFAGVPSTTAGGGASRPATTGLRRFNQRNNPQLNAEVARGGEVTERATLALRSSSPATASTARSLTPLDARAPAAGFSAASTMTFRNAAASSCEDSRHIADCDPFQRYRETDGQCNNLIHASFPSGAFKLGAAFTAQGRFLFPDYDNGVSSPRVRSVSAFPPAFLPNARFVSRRVHSVEVFESDRYTPFLTHFGQFIDHDIVATPEARVVFSSKDPSLHCCLEPATQECFNINFAPDNLLLQQDNSFGTCIDFIRAQMAPDYFCNPGIRYQQNQRSSFIDGSMIYGWDAEQEERLRDPSDPAKLLSQDGQLKLTPVTDPDHQPCIDYMGLCFEAGDHRSLETVPLTVMHIMFLRRHNLIVEAFRAAGLAGDDEILYQEAKRIVIAELQHITYNEFLPRVLGVDSMNRYGLWPAPEYRDTYSPNVDPRTTSGFSVAAYRFGHSLVRNVHNQIGPGGLPVKNLFLQNHFDRLETHRLPFIGGNTEGFARWMKLSRKAGADRFFVDGLRNNLFPCDNPECPVGGGVTRTLDLAALNIQRGRDHGLPSYTAWRYACTGKLTFAFRPPAIGLSDHNSIDIVPLEEAYRNVHDIDLFTGAMTERRLPGALVGPTFACIIGQQFSNYKRGDRFFYERDDPVMAFTPGQLQAIKQTSLAKILCSTMGSFSDVQINAMDRPSFLNPVVACATLRDQDIIAKIRDLWNNLPPSAYRSATAKSAALLRMRRPLVSNRFQDPAFLRLMGRKSY